MELDKATTIRLPRLLEALDLTVRSLQLKCLPAEHGHGTEYDSSKSSQDRWMKMDPLNVLNPGIGGLSSKFRYKDE